jgi:hypothetical protein
MLSDGMTCGLYRESEDESIKAASAMARLIFEQTGFLVYWKLSSLLASVIGEKAGVRIQILFFCRIEHIVFMESSGLLISADSELIGDDTTEDGAESMDEFSDSMLESDFRRFELESNSRGYVQSSQSCCSLESAAFGSINGYCRAIRYDSQSSSSFLLRLYEIHEST